MGIVVESPPKFHAGRFVRNALVLVAAVVLIIYVWEKLNLEDQVIPRNFDVVEAGHVYRSGRLTPRTLTKVVRAHEIKTIIDFGSFEPGSDVAASMHDADERLGVRRHLLPVRGNGTGDPNRYVEALRLIADEANHPVLVQCSAGSQRTGVCLVLYRIILQDWSLDAAYEEAIEHGHDPADNFRLPIYLGRWHGEIDRAFRSGDTIEIGAAAISPYGVPDESSTPHGGG